MDAIVKCSMEGKFTRDDVVILLHSLGRCSGRKNFDSFSINFLGARWVTKLLEVVETIDESETISFRLTRGNISNHNSMNKSENA
jgi:hypothetical protein